MKTKHVYVFWVLLIASSHALWANEEELPLVKRESTTTVPEIKKLSIDNEPDRIGYLSELVDALPTNYNDADARRVFLQQYHALENPFPGSKKLLELRLQKAKDEQEKADLETRLAMLDLLANLDRTAFANKSSDQRWLSYKTVVAVSGVSISLVSGIAGYMLRKFTV